jgi:hypothetical protein
MTGYLEALKEGLTGDPRTPLVFLCNFEVEQHWAVGFPGLPAAPFSLTGPLVTRMEELGALLAGPDDHLVVQHPLDPGYLDYVRSLGIRPPTVLVTDGGQAGTPTAARAVESPELLRRLRELAATGARLVPMGLSEFEVRLSEAAGLPLATPDLATVVAVNSKIYSRRLVESAGLRAVPGWCCETTAELAELLGRIGPDCSPGKPVVVKDAYGVSGKGLVVVDHPRKAERIVRQVERAARRRGHDRLHVVVETWLPKRADLNYQLTVLRDGTVRLDFVKEALTVGGVHAGHLSPPDLTAGQLGEVEHAAAVVGKALHADGFHGVAGVDALVTRDGTVHPVLEINARFNMSTYQGRVLETIGAGLPASLAGMQALHLDRPLPFAELRAVLGPLLEVDPVRGGLVVTCFGTVNTMADRGTPFDGRLYTIALGPDRAAVAALAEQGRRVLDAHLTERTTR